MPKSIEEPKQPPNESQERGGSSPLSWVTRIICGVVAVGVLYLMGVVTVGIVKTGDPSVGALVLFGMLAMLCLAGLYGTTGKIPSIIAERFPTGPKTPKDDTG